MERTLFQKRHYELLASVIRSARLDYRQLARDYPEDAAPIYQGIDRVKRRLTDLLAAESPRFNQKKFEEACEP